MYRSIWVWLLYACALTLTTDLTNNFLFFSRTFSDLVNDVKNSLDRVMEEERFYGDDARVSA